MMRSSLDRLAPTSDHPATWTPGWVKERLVQAFEIERRLPDRRIGPALLRNTWKVATVDSFADRVHQGETAREDVWQRWARAGGATPVEISRMEEAFGWAAILASHHVVEGKCLLAWACSQAGGPPLARILRVRGWSRSTLYRRVDDGAARLALQLALLDVPVR